MITNGLRLVSMFFLMLSTAHSEQKEMVWPEKACEEIHGAIGLFTHLADEEWKKKEEEKGSFYVAVASDYANIFQTVCNFSK